MDKRVAQVSFVIVVLIACVGFLYWEYGRARRESVAAMPSPTASPGAPGVLFPVPDSEGGEALPVLGDSDVLAQTRLATLFADPSLMKLFRTDGMIRRFVATVDALPRRTVPQNLVPLQPVGGRFTPGAENYRRYLPFVILAEAVDAQSLHGAYVSIYPLLQDAYEELGYPDAYFNDRLVVVIDDLLATPDVESPTLVQPNVLWEFEDPALESRSSGQKIMLRMGLENADRVKARLRAIRAKLTSGAAAPR